MKSSLLLLTVLAIVITISSAFRTQSVAVKGKLLCGTKPAANVHVKLLDEDQGSAGDPDDMLDSMLTKSDGLFFVSGFASELTPIDPEVRIYHDCNDHGKGMCYCQSSSTVLLGFKRNLNF